jgi:hypothetical protein
MLLISSRKSFGITFIFKLEWLFKEPLGAVSRLVSSLFAVILGLASCIPAVAMDHYPELPSISDTRAVTTESGFGLCSKVTDYIKSMNSNVKFYDLDANPSSVESGPILLVLSDSAGPLRRNYPNYKELIHDASAGLQGDCDKSVEIYMYDRHPNGIFYRSFHSAPTCLSMGLKIWCSKTVVEPGYVGVQFNPVDVTKNIQRLYDDYGLAAEQYTIPDGQIDETVYEFSVEAGTEEAWVKILSKLPYIDEASRLRALFAAVASEGEFARALAPNSLPRIPLLAASSNGIDGSMTKAIDFFNNKYAGHAREVKILKKNNKRILLQVTGLRGEILSGHDYWEMLLLDCVFSSDFDKNDFFLNTTGRYATGAGNLRPAESAFIDMDREYFETIQHYSDALAAELQTALEK